MKEENYKKEEWGGWKIVSDMLDRPNEYGIYPTGECYQKLYDFVVSQKQKAIAQTREETIREEIAYWTDVFDNRPKDRDLESDNIAQNFARIEIERLENKLK
jgi:hypothetical protein